MILSSTKRCYRSNGKRCGESGSSGILSGRPRINSNLLVKLTTPEPKASEKRALFDTLGRASGPILNCLHSTEPSS